MEDGYHSIRSVMQSVSFGDDITIVPKDKGGYYVQSNIKYLPTGKNIAVRHAVFSGRKQAWDLNTP